MVIRSHHSAAFAGLVACRLLVAAFAVLASAPAFANSPAAPCSWLVEEERFSELSDWKNAVDWDEETYPDVEEAWPKKEKNEFVSFLFGGQIEEQYFWNIGLQHCPTGEGLLIFTTPETDRAMRDAFDAAMKDEAKWSMRDIARHMRKLGSRVRMRTGGLGSCGCENAEAKY